MHRLFGVAALVMCMAESGAAYGQTADVILPAETLVGKPFDKPLVYEFQAATETINDTTLGYKPRPFSRNPELVLNFSLPVDDVVIQSLNDEPVWVTSLYSNKRVNESLAPQRTILLPKAQGLYTIRGSAASKAKVGFVVYSDGTARNPTELSSLLPNELPLERRNIYNWLPLLGNVSLTASDSDSQRMRLQLLMAVPKQLFVTPKTEITAAALNGVTPNAQTPKPGDALLLLTDYRNGSTAHVMTMSGRVFELDDRFLGVSTGKLVVPGAATDIKVGTANSFNVLYNMLSDQERKPLTALREDLEKAGACYTVAISKLDPSWPGHKKAFASADKSCKFSATTKRGEKAKPGMAAKATAKLQKDFMVVKTRVENL